MRKTFNNYLLVALFVFVTISACLPRKTTRESTPESSRSSIPDFKGETPISLWERDLTNPNMQHDTGLSELIPVMELLNANEAKGFIPLWSPTENQPALRRTPFILQSLKYINIPMALLSQQ